MHNSSSDDRSALHQPSSQPGEQVSGPASGKASGKAGSKKTPPAPKQAGFVKLIHSLIILSLLVMSTSGLAIYNSNPVFGGREGWHFPKFLLLGSWLAGGRDWHFAMMWVFSLNLLGYGVYIAITRRWERRFIANSDLKVLKSGSNPKRKAYAWHRLLYTGIIPVLLLAIASGMAMYKPAQWHTLAALFGNWQTLRTVHFLTMPIVLLFIMAHVLMGLKVGGMKLTQSMFRP
jgi:thiosulfate reductase cytochrome b subunit